MKKLDIYIDGSHLNKQHGGRLGCGGVLIDLGGSGKGTKLLEFSKHLEPEYMKLAYGSDKCSNPSAELVAVYEALIAFKESLKGASEITIHADYLGVKEWMTGKWRVKEPYIAKIKQAIEAEILKQRLTGKIKYEWVRGHQRDNGLDPDIYWNNYVDLLAKGQK